MLPESILLVDDEPAVLDGLKRLFARGKRNTVF